MLDESALNSSSSSSTAFRMRDFALALMFFVPLVFITFVHHYSGIVIVAGVILYTIISTFR